MSWFPLLTKAFVDKDFKVWLNPNRKKCISYKGNILTNKGDIQIEFCFFDKTLSSFPKAFILKHNNPLLKPLHFPHLDQNWQICYDEGVKVFDKYRPNEMVKYCIDRVRYAIDITQCNDMKEIIREFSSYWCWDIYVFGNILDSSNSVLIDKRRMYGQPETVFEKHSMRGEFAPIFRLSDLPSYQDIEWPVTTIQNLFAWLKKEVEACSNISKFIKKSIREFKSFCTIVLHSVKQNYYFGIQLEIRSPLIQNRKKTHLQPNTVNRIYDHHCHLIKRIWVSNYTPEKVITSNTEGSPNLMDRKILLIGVGTIGSNLANILVRNGAGTGYGSSLTIIDKDLFEPCNISRHFLGDYATSFSKADSLKEELNRIVPFCNVISKNESIYTSSVLTNKYDLIIDTTGEESLTMWLNEIIDFEETFFISTWVRGQGEAVEAFTKSGNNEACHQCFRISDKVIPYIGDEYPLRGSCGSVYVPFPISVSMYAALLTTDVINQWSVDKLENNFFRQSLNPVKEIESMTIIKDGNCQVCGTSYTQE